MMQMENTINEIDADIHKKVNSDYIKNLEKIEKEDKRNSFENIDEFYKHFKL